MTDRPGYVELARVFLRISLLGFGGPNAHIALMLDEVVERRRWVSRLYFRYGSLPAVEGLFWGLKPFIVAIVLGAGWKLGKSAITDANLLMLAAMGAAVAIWLGGFEVLAILVGGVVGWLLYRRSGLAAGSAGRKPVAPKPPLVGAAPLNALAFVPMLAAGGGELTRLLLLTLWTGSVLFGGGYMLVALLEPYVVAQYGWLTQAQFLDGIAITQSAPGPIVMLVTFIGYSVAGVAGAAVATAGIYALPSFLAVFTVAPHLAKWRGLPSLRAALKGVNAVVTGRSSAWASRSWHRRFPTGSRVR